MDHMDGGPLRAALYIRVSTDRQAERYGLSSQKQELMKRLAAKGYALVRDGEQEAFADDGYSGGDLRRPALARLREAVEQHLCDIVLVFDPDRLSRNLKDQLLLTDDFEGAGVRLEFLTQEMDASPEGKLFFAIRGAVAEYEKEKIRERTARGRREKARQGKPIMPSALPVWLGWEETRGFFLKEDWAHVVRRIYELFVYEGLPIRRIATQFTQEGLPTPSGGTHWQHATIARWLKETTAKGDYISGRAHVAEPQNPRKIAPKKRKSSRMLAPEEDWIVIPVPPVVSEDLWEAAHQRLEQNKKTAPRNARRFYLLRGLLRCGHCGGRMHGYCHDDSQPRYYRCSHYVHGNSRVDGTGGCNRSPVLAKPLEDAVWQRIAELFEDPDALERELNRRKEEGSPTRTMLQEHLASCSRRLEKIPEEENRLLDGYAKGLFSDALLKRKLDAIHAEQRRLQERLLEAERQLHQLEEEQTLTGNFRSFAEQVRKGLHTMTDEQRADLLKLVVVEITVDGPSITIRTRFPGDGSHGRLCLTDRAPEPGTRPPL